MLDRGCDYLEESYFVIVIIIAEDYLKYNLHYHLILRIVFPNLPHNKPRRRRRRRSDDTHQINTVTREM